MRTDERIYIAGPMRGIKEFNFPAFFEAERKIKALGYTEVHNPARIDVEDSAFDHRGLTGNEDLFLLGFDLESALAYDLWLIELHTDTIVALEGWSKSIGAMGELELGFKKGLKVYDLDHFLKLHMISSTAVERSNG